MTRRLFPFLALAFLLPLCGCRTYLGYDLENVEVLAQSEELVRTSPPSEIRIEVKERPTQVRPQMLIEVQGHSTAEYRVSKEVKETRKGKYRKWSFRGEVFDLTLGAVCAYAFGTIDLIAKGLGFDGLESYASHRPPYWMRLAQTYFIKVLNPFQQVDVHLGSGAPDSCVVYDDNVVRRIVKDGEERSAWNPLADRLVTVAVSRFNCTPIRVRTNARGQTRVDFSSWGASLEPGKSLDVIVSTEFGKVRGQGRFLCSTDDLMGAVTVAEAAKKPAEETPPSPPPVAPQTPEKPKPTSPAPPDCARLQAARRVALVIGIDKYEHCPPLRSAVSDARGIATVLRSSYGFSEVRELLDAQATRAGILEALESLTVAVKKGDGVLLFFAGHGEYNEALSRGAWVPVDAQSSADFLPNSAIHDFVKAMDVRGAGHVLVVADSCFSGSFLDTTRSADRALGVRPASAKGAELPRYLEKLWTSPSRRALTSGSIEPVPDSAGGDHSPFTRCLLEALRNPEHDAFTATELAAKVQRLVGLNSEQTPRYGVIKFAGDMAGEFVFLKRESSGKKE